jgi:glycosyltransferase involved in cell wall biosynthesis
VLLPGLYSGPTEAVATLVPPSEPRVLFVGRHIAEKRVHLIPQAVAAARADLPTLRATILGDGPERPGVLGEIERLGLAGVIDAPGFTSDAEMNAALHSSTCLLLPSMREGYGLIVVEAAAAGTPVVVVAGSDNAAVELIEPGVNGFVAADAEPVTVAAALANVHHGGRRLRESTAHWFAQHAEQLSASTSARAILAAYAEP